MMAVINKKVAYVRILLELKFIIILEFEFIP